MKKFFFILLFAVVVLGAVLGINTWRFKPRHFAVQPVPEIPVDSVSAAVHLGGALVIPTISYQDSSAVDRAAFLRLQAYLASTYAAGLAQLSREQTTSPSLLFRWQGRDSLLQPVIFLAHQDVVPVDSGAGPGWRVPPFSGRMQDGYVWGRGALDDKSSLVAIMEAVNALALEGFSPQRTLYFAFGHDEEIGGRGAAVIAAALRRRNISPLLVLDEGGMIADGIIPGIKGPVALIGIAEKGYMSVELSVEGGGGHSSMPPRETAVGILAGAVSRLEKQQMPARLDGPAREMFQWLGPDFALGQRVVFANLWLFEPLVVRSLAGKPSTAALVRTTTAPTMLEGSPKENVLPQRARAVVNFRLRPGDEIMDVLYHIREVVDDDRVKITPLGKPAPASLVSTTETEGFKTLSRTIREVLRPAHLAPFLVIGATDARYYARWSRNVYRFSPIVLKPADIERIHGTDERIGVAAFADAVRFYIRLIRNMDALEKKQNDLE